MAEIMINSIPQFEEVLNNNPVVLTEFFASWCPHCQHFAPLLAQAAEQLPIPVARVEIDQNPELSGYYEIESIPTLILFVNGTPVAKHIGVIEPQQVIDFVNENTPQGM